MTTSDKLKAVMDQFYGGSDGRYRHWANRRFIYTEGIKAMAEEAGAFWLLDIVATEVAPLCLKRWQDLDDPTSFLKFQVKADQIVIALIRDTGELPLWSRSLNFTDFPEGEWTFELAIDGLVDPNQDVLVMLLPQEH